MSQNANDNSPPGNGDKYKTLISNLVAIVIAPLTAKYVADAATQQTIISAISAIAIGLVNLLPLIYELWRKPSAAAMSVAVQADNVMAGKANNITVPTGPGKPDITLKAA